MGVPKHGKESARSKSCKKYKESGKAAINKAEKAAKIAAGKKIKSRKQYKTGLMKWENLIRNTKKSVPYCDAAKGTVWGKDQNLVKEAKKNGKKNQSAQSAQTVSCS